MGGRRGARTWASPAHRVPLRPDRRPSSTPHPSSRAIVADLRRGADAGAPSRPASMPRWRTSIGDVAERQRARTGIDRVALSGGVFQNVLLLGLARRELEARAFRRPDPPGRPPNDGGLALGQVAIARLPRRRVRGRGRHDGPCDTTDGIAAAVAGPAEDLAPAALALARRFAAGATMWCVAPQWPAHGRHVAVEFVHPVIVGKRALPAVSIDGPDGGRVRPRCSSRPGDVLLVRQHGGRPGGARPARRGPRPGA